MVGRRLVFYACCLLPAPRPPRERPHHAYHFHRHQSLRELRTSAPLPIGPLRPLHPSLIKLLLICCIAHSKAVPGKRTEDVLPFYLRGLQSRGPAVHRLLEKDRDDEACEEHQVDIPAATRPQRSAQHDTQRKRHATTAVCRTDVPDVSSAVLVRLDEQLLGHKVQQGRHCSPWHATPPPTHPSSSVSHETDRVTCNR